MANALEQQRYFRREDAVDIVGFKRLRLLRERQAERREAQRRGISPAG